MNNDLYNNHSSESSNMYVANKRYPQLNKYVRNKAMLDTQSKGNKTIFFDSDNELRPSNQKELLISQSISKYPANYAPGPNPYNDGIIQGYYVNPQEDPSQRYNRRNLYQYPLRDRDDDDQMNNEYYERNIENGGEDIEDEEGNEGDYEEDMDLENGKNYVDVSPQQDPGYYNDYVGDGNVRNNIPNYSPDSNGQNVRYYKKKKFNAYNNNNYNNYDQENENEDNQYIMESPQDNYKFKSQPYKRRRVLGSLGDSASSEAYANKNNQNNQSPENYSRIYVKPKTKYNNSLNNANNGISTEERGIESQRESPNNNLKNGSYLRKPYHYIDSEENDSKKAKFNKMNNYDEDSINVVEPPLYNHPLNPKNKGGKVDLNNYARMKNRTKRDEDDEDDFREDLDDDYEINEEKIVHIIKLQRKVKSHIKITENKVTKIQSIWRGRSTRKIMKLYHDLEEFIFLISMVNFNHFSDNFFYFINQLFNVYKAKTLKNQMDSPDEEKEDNQNEEEEDETKDDNDKSKKKYDKLLNDYNNLQEKYNDLVNRNNYPPYKKNTNNDVVSLPGETTIGSIKTDNRKFPRFRPLNNNNSTSVLNNENLTFSNDNDDLGNNRDYERRFYTPDQEDEDSFNDGSKDKRFSYSSIHSEENSKYFDNEQPGKGPTSGKRNISLKNKGLKNPKIGLLSLNKVKDRVLSYSPSSRGNSANKNKNDSRIENRINNISIVPKHEDEFEIPRIGKELDYIDQKQLEDDIYDKYAKNFGKDLHIVKNNKINLKNKDDKKLYCFDNELIYPESENNIELVAPKKTDEQRINDIIDNKRLLEKMKNRLNKMTTPEKKKFIKHFGDSITLKNDKNIDDYLPKILKKPKNEIQPKTNNLEILQNDRRKFDISKLNLESNELFLGEEKELLYKQKMNKLVPRFEYSINIKKIKRLKKEPNSFSKEKTLPTFDTEDKNAFTIKNRSPKTEKKQIGFPEEKTMIDSVYNSEFSLIESNPVPTKIKKEIVYVPLTDNAFKRLRRSKRTKDTYFTIEGEEPLEKKDLSKTNENNFEIKSEYVYVETNDEPPKVIEKEVKETIVIEKPNENAGRFNDDKVKYSNEDNFDIKADKNKKKYYEDIDKNELMIPSDKTHKKVERIWNDLNPIANDEFSLKNDYDYESDNIPEEKTEDNKSFDINNEQFEIIDDKRDKQKNYAPSKENDIKLRGHHPKREEKDVQADIRPVKTTAKTIIKVNKNDDNENVPENAFSIYGTKPKEVKKEIPLIEDANCQINIKRKKKSLKDNETATDFKPIKEFDNIEHMNNDNFDIKREEKQMKDEGTEITEELKEIKKEIPLETVKNEDLKIKREKKKTKETETEIDDDLNKIEPSNNNELMYSPSKKKVDNIISKGDNLDIYAPEKETILEPSKIEDINLESRNRAFPRLDMNNCLNQTISGKEKEKPILDYNESFTFEPKKKDIKYLIENNEILIKSKPKEKEKRTFGDLDIDKSEDYNVMGKEPKKDKKRKKKMKESETQIDDDLTNIRPEKNHDLVIEPPESLKKRKEKYMDERDQFLIEGKDRNEGLEKEYLEDLNIEPSRNRKFSNLNLDKCQDETFKGKEKEKVILKLINNEPIVLSGKERDDLLELIQNEPIAFNGKEIADMIKYIQNESINIPAKPKEKPYLDLINNEPIELKGDDINKNLDAINNEPIMLNAKEKEPLDYIQNEPIVLNGKEIGKDLEPIKNEDIRYKPKKKKMKEAETKIDNDINSDLVQNDNDQFTYDPIKPKKKDNIIVKNDELNIKNNKDKNKDLKLDKQKSLNINQDNKNKEFDNDALELFHPENVEVLPEEKSPVNADNLVDFVDNIELRGKPDLEKTKNNIIKVYKVMKLINALKNKKNKKDFMDKLKENDLECIANNEIELQGDEIDKQFSDLDKQPQDQFIIRKKKKKLNDNATEITDELNPINPIQNDDFSLEGKNKENEKKEKDEPEDKDKEIVPIKEKERKPKKKKKTKKPKNKQFKDLQNTNEDAFSVIDPKEKKKKKVKMQDETTQTPKLRQNTKAPQKVIFHEIKNIIKKDKKPLNQYDPSKQFVAQYHGKGERPDDNKKIIVEEKDEDVEDKKE